MSEAAGTNPDSTFASAPEDVVANILSRGEEETSAQTADSSQEPGDQQNEDAAADTTPETETEAKPDVTVKPEESSPFKLPTQQAAEYPKDVMAHYAKRYGTNLKDAEANPALKAAIKQAIDKDIFIEQQKAMLAEIAAPKQTPPETKKDETAAAEAKPAVTTQDHILNLGKELETASDPEMTKLFAKELWKNMAGADIDAPEAQARLKELGIDPMGLPKTIGTFGLNLVRTVVPPMLEQMRAEMQQQMAEQVEANFPGFGAMYENTARLEAWEKVVEANDSYKGLPDFGSKAFNDGINKVLTENPWINEAVFRDDQGKQLGAQESRERRYSIAARLMSGQQVTSADVEKALNKGKEIQANAARTAARGKLDSGKSGGNIATGKPSSGGSEFVDAYNARHASM